MVSQIKINKADVISKIDDRLYGSFIEHMGRAVYSGIYQPDHESADLDGFRNDTAQLVKQLNVPIVRYPGGNFVSGYKWEDGIGEKSKRPVRLDVAWNTLETNEFGTDEFMRWCKKVDTQCMMAVNLGTRGISEAMDLVEYCNFNGGTYYSDLRRKNGSEQPYNIKTWCLGNEMDGQWQTGHKTATEYARLANETAKAMKNIDSNIELVACGSSNRNMSTFGYWEETVLNECYDNIDYISLHQYFNDIGEMADAQSFLSQGHLLDKFIKDVVNICDSVKAKLNKSKQINLSFDEWNIWYHSNQQDNFLEKWVKARPLLEDIYDYGDCILFSSMINALINNSNRVKIACLAQLVNVIAPIMTNANGDAYKQTIYYPFYYASNYGRGNAINAKVDCPSYNCNAFGSRPVLDVSVTFNQQTNEYLAIIVNTSLNSDTVTNIELPSDCKIKIIEHSVIKGKDLKITNNEKQQNVCPVSAQQTVLNNTIKLNSNACSVNFIRFSA